MKRMKAKFKGQCQLCGTTFQKDAQIIGLGFDRANASRGYAHLDCWTSYENQQIYRAEDKPIQGRPLPICVKAGHNDLYGHKCPCGCERFFSANMWVIQHPIPDEMHGEWLYWRCSAHRIWHYLEPMLPTEEELPLLRTVTYSPTISSSTT